MSSAKAIIIKLASTVDIATNSVLYIIISEV